MLCLSVPKASSQKYLKIASLFFFLGQEEQSTIPSHLFVESISVFLYTISGLHCLTILYLTEES